MHMVQSTVHAFSYTKDFIQHIYEFNILNKQAWQNYGVLSLIIDANSLY